jgi:hypothetical protein
MRTFTWVYKYRYWDEERQENAVSEEMFTLEAIRDGLGVAIIESGRKVGINEVDGAGQLKRRRSQRDVEQA